MRLPTSHFETIVVKNHVCTVVERAIQILIRTTVRCTGAYFNLIAFSAKTMARIVLICHKTRIFMLEKSSYEHTWYAKYVLVPTCTWEFIEVNETFKNTTNYLRTIERQLEWVTFARWFANAAQCAPCHCWCSPWWNFSIFNSTYNWKVVYGTDKLVFARENRSNGWLDSFMN